MIFPFTGITFYQTDKSLFLKLGNKINEDAIRILEISRGEMRCFGHTQSPIFEFFVMFF
jgi:hypothetical protein